jgi:hypothetical protein
MARPLLAGCFAAGFAIALWDPHPRLILTVAIGITSGMLVLGPYAAAALYSLRLQRLWGGHLRWPLCLVLALSAVLLLDYLLGWSPLHLGLASGTALLGTVLGHDATLAVLELRLTPHLDSWMVVLFPLLVGLAVLAGYCSLGFGAGTYAFIAALIR